MASDPNSGKKPLVDQMSGEVTGHSSGAGNPLVSQMSGTGQMYAPTRLRPWEGSRAVLPTWAGGGTRFDRWGGGPGAPNAWRGGRTNLKNFDPSTVNLEEDPGYKFRVAEGMKAINRGAAAGSGGRTGATLKALQRYGQNMASQEYGNAYNRAVQRYQMDRQNTMDTRAMARDDYMIGRDENQLAYDRALQGYDIGRQNLREERSFDVQDHNLATQRAMEQRSQDLQDYQIGRQNQIDERGFDVEDYSLHQDAFQRQIDNTLRQHAFDLTKYETTHGVRQADKALELDKYGIDKEVEFRARQQKMERSQNRFNNVLTGLGIISSFF